MTPHPAPVPLTPCRVWRGARNTPEGYGVKIIAGERKYLHRWIVEQVEGPLLPGEIVMHTCDNPPCFLYEHLRRGTHAMNGADRDAKGRHRYIAHRGEDNGMAKLTKQQVRQLRRERLQGTTYRELAEQFSISESQVLNICTRNEHGWRSV